MRSDITFVGGIITGIYLCFIFWIVNVILNWKKENKTTWKQTLYYWTIGKEEHKNGKR